MKICVTLAFAAFASPLLAQDTRSVAEPVIPPTCAALDAQIKWVGTTLAPSDATKLDTERIQKAMDKCGKGKSVELRVPRQL